MLTTGSPAAGSREQSRRESTDPSPAPGKAGGDPSSGLEPAAERKELQRRARTPIPWLPAGSALPSPALPVRWKKWCGQLTREQSACARCDWASVPAKPLCDLQVALRLVKGKLNI